MTNANKIKSFIAAARNISPLMKKICLNGSCYRFFLLLKEVFPEAVPFYTTDYHVLANIDGQFYDITGEIVNPERAWEMSEKEIKSQSKFACNIVFRATDETGNEVLRDRGIESEIVLPELDDRFFVYILGRGEKNKDGGFTKNQGRLGPLTLVARKYFLEQILHIQDQVNSAALVQGKPLVVLINGEELARIKELIALETYPNKWDGTEMVGDETTDKIFRDGTVQPWMFDEEILIN